MHDRPGHDRRYSLSSDKVRALGWEAQVRFAEGLRRDRRLVPGQRVLVGARSAPASTATYYERQYGRALRD